MELYVMVIENVIYFVLGFLVAGLLGLLIIPSIWKRAVRLTRKRIESANPVTMAEFCADKDQLRAQFALSTRKLEMRIESLRTRLSEQLVELNENRSALALVGMEHDRQSIQFDELEARNEAARDRIIELEKKVTDLSQRLRMRERELIEAKSRSEKEMSDHRFAETGIKEADPSDIGNMGNIQSGLHEAEAQIASASSKFEGLLQLDEDGQNEKIEGGRRSLAEEFIYEEGMVRLHDAVGEIENDISRKWDKGNVGEDENEVFRKRLNEIASLVSSLVYSEDSDKPSNPGESLFDRVQKFVGQNVDGENSEQSEKPPTDPYGARSISSRITSFHDAGSSH